VRSGLTHAILSFLVAAATLACGEGPGTDGEADAARTADTGQSDAGATPPAGDAAASDAAGAASDAAPSPSCPGASSEPPTDQALTRRAQLNDTTVELLFLSPLYKGAPDALTFKVAMTNHTCSIPGYENDLVGHVRIETADGLSVEDGYTYAVLSDDGHHPAGLLTYPRRVDGSPVLACDTAWFRVTISGVDGGEGEFEWLNSAFTGIAGE